MAFLFAACTGRPPLEHTPAARSGRVSVRLGDPSSFPISYVAGNQLFDADDRTTRRLAGAVGTDLVGTLSPAGVPIDSGAIIYNSSSLRSPILRITEADGNRDRVFAREALSAAVRRDGAVAYFQGLRPFVEPKRFLGHVVVREGNRVLRWTASPGRYVVAAWAGNRLLTYRLREGWPDLLVLDGSGRARRLAKAGALVAVSPDGNRAVISRYGATPPRLTLVDLGTGRSLDRLLLSKPVDGFSLDWVIESGSWRRNLVAAPANAGVVIFRVVGDALSVIQVLQFDTSRFTPGSWQPQFVRSDQEIAVRAELVSPPREAIPRAALIVCDRQTLRCSQGPTVGSFNGPWPIYDPSRP